MVARAEGVGGWVKELKGIKRYKIWGTWLSQLVEHMTLDLRIMSSGPTLGIEIT